MEKKKIITLFSLLVLAVFLSQIVAAQGILDEAGLAPIKKALISPVDLPIKSAATALSITQESYPISIVLLVWIGLFALLYMVLNQIFGGMQNVNRAAVGWMAFALSGIAVIGSPYVRYITTLVSFFGVFFYVMLIILIAYLAWALFHAGRGAVGNLSIDAARGRAEANKKRYEVEKEERDTRRDLDTQEKSYKREDQAIQQAETLLKTGVKNIKGAERQIQKLLSILEQIRQIRDVGQAEKLKASFDQQAGVVAASITAESRLEPELRKLEGFLEQLTKLDYSHIAKLEAEVTAIRGVAAGAAPHANAGNLTRIQQYISNLRAMESQQANLLKQATEITGKIPSLTTTAASLMQAVVRDVYSGNYPDAAAKLNQALSDLRAEGKDLTAVSQLLYDIDKHVKDQIGRINGAKALVP